MAYKQVEHANESWFHVTSDERGAMLTRAGTLPACTPRCSVTNVITYLRYNFPEVDLRAITADQRNFVRVCDIHHNIPGVLRRVNEILSDHNVEKQFSDSKGSVAYLMADIAGGSEEDVQAIYDKINRPTANIITRLLA